MKKSARRLCLALFCLWYVGEEQGLDKIVLSLSSWPLHFKCAFQIEAWHDISLAGA